MADDMKTSDVQKEESERIAFLERRLARSETARKEAESLLEDKARLVALRSVELQQREAELINKMEISAQELIRAEKTGRIATLHWPKNKDLSYSPFFREMLGIEADGDSIAERAWRAVHPLDRARVTKLRQEFLSAPPGTDHSYDCRMITPAGEMMWFKWSMSKQADADGQVVGIYGTVQDITEARAIGRKAKALQLVAERRIKQLNRTSEQLAKVTERERQNAAYLQAVLNNVPLGVAVFDDDLRLVSWNDKLMDLIGPRYDDMFKGMEYSAFHALKSEYHGGNLDTFSQVERDGSGNVKSQKHLLRRGDGRHIQISVAPYNGGMVRTYSDISELKIIESRLREQRSQLGERVDELETLSSALRSSKLEAERANRAKSEFLAMMSHDIRTPMNGVLGMLSMLEETKLSEPQKKQLDLAVQSGELLKILLDDIIDLARAEAGAISLEPAPTVLDLVVTGVMDFWSGAAKAKGIELDTDRDPHLPSALLIDPTRFRQLLNNLVSNAIKYTPGPSGKISVSLLSRQRDERRFLRVEVADNGMGVPEDIQSSLFANFTRSPEVERSEIEGVGLGLAICHRLISAMEGDIGLKSKEGLGSMFWFEIPLEEAVAPIEISTENLPPAQIHNLKGETPHILIAEDVEANQFVIASMLDSFGCTSELAENGQVATEMLRDRKFDLVLMDVSMPVLDGKEATKIIRKMDGIISGIPIIGVTAHAMETERENLLAIGMDQCLAKPIDKHEFASAIRAALDKVQVDELELMSRSEVKTVIDVDQFRSVLEALSKDRRASLQETLYKDLTASVLHMEEAYIDQSEELLSRAQHRLKGVAQTFGFSGLLDQANAADLSSQDSFNEFKKFVDLTLNEIDKACDV
ncbi:ATP-binding protein [Parasphingorhabdus sp.]|uniref:PAS domain-containing hybrid sensor histidine kinase/response regulator n=1 Tax=Parasphingorhabdus sp. TaxID=2709688 RepID=UPI0032652F15